jgi:uncharacterized phage protein (TIGR01671 family)
MREIKFRGLSLEKNEWLYGSLIIFPDDNKHSIGHTMLKVNDNQDDNQLVTEPVDHKSVGQFTGLLDKNGKEVYEGDILRTEHTTPLLVVYEDGGFCFYNDLTSGADRLAQNRCERLEIYGNVHENKDLLNT